MRHSMFPPKPKTTSPHGGVTAAKVIVAVKAETVISKSELAWAVAHAARPGEGIILLAVFSDKKAGIFAQTHFCLTTVIEFIDS